MIRLWKASDKSGRWFFTAYLVVGCYFIVGNWLILGGVWWLSLALAVIWWCLAIVWLRIGARRRENQDLRAFLEDLQRKRENWWQN